MEIDGQSENCTAQEKEKLLQRNSPQTANLSLNLFSPPDLPRVDGQGLLRVQHTAAESRLGSELLHHREMKQDSQNCGRLRASYKAL